MPDDRRPNPDLLRGTQQAEEPVRGKLKIFLATPQEALLSYFI